MCLKERLSSFAEKGKYLPRQAVSNCVKVRVSQKQVFLIWRQAKCLKDRLRNYQKRCNLGHFIFDLELAFNIVSKLG